ncbi:MAG: hypothetical protein ACE14L_06665 [Terriglobales bacterium]
MAINTRKLVQIVLAVAIVAAAARLFVIYRGRHAPPPKAAPAPPLEADYYVYPRKLYAYDLNSARQLTKQPVWAREGYKYTFYPYDPRTRQVDFRNEAGQLGPIEKLQIKDVISVPMPRAAFKAGEVRVAQREVMAVFEKNGKTYAVPIGVEQGGNYTISADEIFYIQDPLELYKHWPRDVWDAIEQHRVIADMSELQAAFAVGMGITESTQGDIKVVRYANGGRPLKVTFAQGRAVSVTPERS